MRLSVTYLPCLFAVGLAAGTFAVTPTGVKDVRVEPATFNPSENQTVTLKYVLSSAAKVRIRVYDPEDLLVRTLLNWQSRAAGENAETWDGRDGNGSVVPDEAYYFTIEAKDGAKATIYDPIQVSGGEEIEPTGVSYDLAARELEFSIPGPARVMVRAGIRNGPLMKTVIDWAPFGAGDRRIPWDGKDESGLIDVSSREDLKLYALAYALPNATAIAFGNGQIAYADYISRLPKDHPRKPYGRTASRKVLISPFWGRPPRFSRSIAFVLDDLAVSGGFLKATATLAPAEAQLLRGVAYEMIFYIDGSLVTEDERGHSPYPISLEVSKLAAGQHVLTVNVASVTDRIGSRSLVFSVPAGAASH